MSCSEDGRKYPAFSKGNGAERGKVGCWEKKDSSRGFLAGPGVAFSQGKGEGSGEQRWLGSLEAVTLAKCPSLLRKKQGLLLGNRQVGRLQNAVATSLVLGWVLCSSSFSRVLGARDPSAVNLVRKQGRFSQPLHFNLQPWPVSVSPTRGKVAVWEDAFLADLCSAG